MNCEYPFCTWTSKRSNDKSRRRKLNAQWMRRQKKSGNEIRKQKASRAARKNSITDRYDKMCLSSHISHQRRKYRWRRIDEEGENMKPYRINESKLSIFKNEMYTDALFTISFVLRARVCVQLVDFLPFYLVPSVVIALDFSSARLNMNPLSIHFGRFLPYIFFYLILSKNPNFFLL